VIAAQAPPPPAPEKAYAQAVVDLARLAGWDCYRTHDSRRSPPGFPDLVLLRPPAVLFRELKVAGRRPTPRQRAWLDGLVACGLDAAIWVFPDDWDLAVDTLTRRSA
jgi:hypothetical protein